MRASKYRQGILSLRITSEWRQYVEQTAAKLTIETGKRHSMTDVVEQALEMHRRELERNKCKK